MWIRWLVGAGATMYAFATSPISRQNGTQRFIDRNDVWSMSPRRP